MIDLKEKTDDIKELEIPEIKNENNEEKDKPTLWACGRRNGLDGRGIVQQRHRGTHGAAGSDGGDGTYGGHALDGRLAVLHPEA